MNRRAGQSRSRPARRRRLPSYLVVVLALGLIGGAYAALAPSGQAADRLNSSAAVEAGRLLFLQGCSSCHGLQAEGGFRGPSLIGVGAAAVDFQVGTGRMPLSAPGRQAERKPRLYSQSDIDQLAAYIQSIGGGPAQPIVNINDADLALGNALFKANCAQCHNFAGQGGALTYGKYAPELAPATAREIVEAMITGPENMPVFGPAQLSDFQKDSIAKYLLSVRQEANPGGAGLGRVGPVTEGLVVWLVGIGALLAFTLWIGARA